MHEQAGDLMDHDKDFNRALESYLKANCFQKAIKLCSKSASQIEAIEQQVKPALLISLDLKRN